MKSSLTLATLIAIGAAAYAPLPSTAQNVELYIGSAPPAPMYERAPAVRRGYVWSPGYWDWRGHRHYWVPGTYIAERPGYIYAPPAWHQRGGRWYMQQGGWSPRGGERYYGGGYGGRDGYRDGYHRDRDRDGMPDRYERRSYGRDTDRDGVPNRYDRDLDNDGVSNRRDRDRDGDGRPNHYDSRPDNPYRR
ncbi:YXWGXW repeat-containing protein [Massilia sp. Leaf139]|uniref:YXWGXW repeat-containing protein n=1 Tax=Massilia sp. Leaf139 TaxID=1736272 RepID=UPI000700DF19|nr:YXWGXW repeat-containing protein [Massilia sp. Leaf139]KQQ89269.1 hypothetical protein ASF77_11545 [Massilia sp. Leaf139]